MKTKKNKDISYEDAERIIGLLEKILKVLNKKVKETAIKEHRPWIVDEADKLLEDLLSHSIKGKKGGD